MQNGPMVCYVMHELELVVFTHALKMWRNYLMANKFESRTYHSGIQYLFEKQNPNVRQLRCLKFMCEFYLIQTY